MGNCQRTRSLAARSQAHNGPSDAHLPVRLTPVDRRKKLADGRTPHTSSGMKTWRWIGGSLTTFIAVLFSQMPAAELSLPRPGAVMITDVTGDVTAGMDDQQKPVKVDDRLRIGSTITTGRKSMATVMLSNGATLQIGSESALEVEEFGQAPISGSVKFAELKEEPTLSRTLLKLVRGDVAVQVKPLKVSRGSTFMLTIAAGTVKVGEGSFRASVRMSDLGLGVCTLEVQTGNAEFELVGASFAPVPAGRKLAFALEVDKTTGVLKVGEMPKVSAKAKEEAKR
jgi:hypothetical protein